MALNHPLVATQQRTCGTCPEQWEGTLTTGHIFYFRYRSGWASLGIALPGADPVDDPGEVGVKHGDPLQGVFGDDTARSEVFGQLVRRRLPRAGSRG